MSENPDPSRSSHYVTDAFYAELVENFSDWQGENRVVRDAELRDECRMVLEREARFLDDGRFEDWLALYARECLYWVPATRGGGDPRREVAIAFDDHRRLEDRIYRLKTGHAWSQVPPSRTVHHVSNVEVFATGADDIFMVRSNLMVSEFRTDAERVLSGWCAHRLHQGAGGWEILVKQVNLLQYDQHLRNPSFIF